MTTEWGKPPAPWGAPPAPTNEPAPASSWGAPVSPPQQSVPTQADGWGAPLGSAGWQTSPPLPPSDAVPEPTWPAAWPDPLVHDEVDLSTPSGGAIYAKASEGNLPDWKPDDGWIQRMEQAEVDEHAERAKIESDWKEARTMEAEERAGVLNSLNETRGKEWVVSEDGELDALTEVIPSVIRDGERGYYLAYHSGKILHAVLSGPYPTLAAVNAIREQCWQRFINDGWAKLAFSNDFNKAGLYVAEIPLSAKRPGAYGVLTP